MRKYLNRLLSPLGYELRRLDPFETQFSKLLESRAAPKFVQVGANDGVRFDGLYAKATRYGCPGLAIEPLPDMYERLKTNYAPHKQVECLNMAVHATARSVELYRVAPRAATGYPDWATGIASFNREHLLRHDIRSEDIEPLVVLCAPLMELVTARGLLDADVLQIDVEGYDAEIVKMVDFERFRPKLIKFEHKNLSSQDRESTVNLLRSKGYRIESASGDTVAWLRN